MQLIFVASNNNFILILISSSNSEDLWWLVCSTNPIWEISFHSPILFAFCIQRSITGVDTRSKIFVYVKVQAFLEITSTGSHMAWKKCISSIIQEPGEQSWLCSLSGRSITVTPASLGHLWTSYFEMHVKEGGCHFL